MRGRRGKRGGKEERRKEGRKGKEKERKRGGSEKSTAKERKGQSVWKEHGRTAAWRMPRQHALQVLGGSGAARAGCRACAEWRVARKRQAHAYDRARDDGAVLEGDGHRLAGEAHQKTNEFHCCSRLSEGMFSFDKLFSFFSFLFYLRIPPVCNERMQSTTSGRRVHNRRQSARAVANDTRHTAYGIRHTAYRAPHTKHRHSHGCAARRSRGHVGVLWGGVGVGDLVDAL